MSDAYIDTFSGNRVNLTNPNPDAIALDDIAHGLSHICRFSGQCKEFYSVATHSLSVSEELRSETALVQLYGLLHDAPEAFIADLPGPVKRNLDGYREIESRILEAVWRAFELPEPSRSAWEKIEDADMQLRNYEAANLTKAEWPERVELEYRLSEDSKKAKKRFTERFWSLKRRL